MTLEDLVRKAMVTVWNEADPPFACRHVIAGSPLRMVCGEHPMVGLLCTSCMAVHSERHPGRSTCFACGTATETALAHVDIGPGRLVTVATPADGWAVLPDWPVVLFVMLCAGCVPKAKRQVAPIP